MTIITCEETVQRTQQHDERVELWKLFKDKLDLTGYTTARDRRAHNNLQPIAQLPAEILLPIFTTYVAEAPKDGVRNYRDPLSAIRLSQVCSHWRWLVIGFPTLWTEIDLRWPAWMAGYLPYSQELPLTVTYDLGPDSLQRDLPAKAILGYVFGLSVARITKMHVTSCSRHVRLLHQIFPPSIPSLQHLVLAIMDRNKEDVVHRQVPAFVLQLQNIHHLELVGWWAVKTPLRLLHSTTHTLQIELNKLSNKFPLNDFIHALKGLSQLKVLTFKNIFDSVVQLPLSGVVLPRLAKLEIGEHTETCTRLLQAIVAPTLMALQVLAIDCRCIGQLNRLCLAVNRTIANSPSFPSPHHLNLVHSKAHRLISSTNDLGRILYLQVAAGTGLPQEADLLPVLSCPKLMNISSLTLLVESLCPSVYFLSHKPSILTLRLKATTIPLLLRPIHAEGVPTIAANDPFNRLRTFLVDATGFSKDYKPSLLDEISAAFRQRTPPEHVVAIQYEQGLTCAVPLYKAIARGIVASYEEYFAKGCGLYRGRERQLWFLCVDEANPTNMVRFPVKDFGCLDWPDFAESCPSFIFKFWLEGVPSRSRLAH